MMNLKHHICNIYIIICIILNPIKNILGGSSEV